MHCLNPRLLFMSLTPCIFPLSYLMKRLLLGRENQEMNAKVNTMLCGKASLIPPLSLKTELLFVLMCLNQSVIQEQFRWESGVKRILKSRERRTINDTGVGRAKWLAWSMRQMNSVFTFQQYLLHLSPPSPHPNPFFNDQQIQKASGAWSKLGK